MKWFKGIMKTTVVIFSVAALVACGGGSEEPASEDGEVVWSVGTDANFPPFEKQDGGKIVGFDIDVIEAIGEAQGVTVDVQHLGWDGTFDAIEKGKADLAIAAITIDEERQKSFDFSEPYFEAKQMILVRDDSTTSSFSDLEGKNIGVQSATTGDKVVQKQFGKTYKGLKGYEDIPAAIDDLLNGRLDAIVADDFVIKEYIKQIGEQGFKSIDDEDAFETEHYAIIVKKGNSELLAEINEGLKEIQDNGKYDEIVQQYFSEDIK